MIPFNPVVQIDSGTWTAVLKWAAGLFATGAAGISLRFSRRIRSAILNRFRSISEETALREAKRYLGPSVTEAVPFRIPGYHEQFIAVLRSTSVDPVSFRGEVTVLRGSKGYYELTPTPLEQLRNGRRYREHFGVTDVRGNGNREIFLVSYTAGSGAESVDLALYDVVSAEHLQVSLFRVYHAVPPEIRYTGDFSINLAARKWLGTYVARMAALYAYTPTDRGARVLREAEEDWVARHGAGYQQGTLSLVMQRGPMPCLKEAQCTVDDGAFIWASFFKGPVLGYHKATHRWFVLYVPPSQYEWVSRIVVGEQYLWLNGRWDLQEPGIPAVKRGTWELKIVPAREAQPWEPRFAGARIGAEVLGSAALVFPKWIKDDEFRNPLSSDPLPSPQSP